LVVAAESCQVRQQPESSARNRVDRIQKSDIPAVIRPGHTLSCGGGESAQSIGRKKKAERARLKTNNPKQEVFAREQRGRWLEQVYAQPHRSPEPGAVRLDAA